MKHASCITDNVHDIRIKRIAWWDDGTKGSCQFTGGAIMENGLECFFHIPVPLRADQLRGRFSMNSKRYRHRVVVPYSQLTAPHYFCDPIEVVDKLLALTNCRWSLVLSKTNPPNEPSYMAIDHLVFCFPTKRAAAIAKMFL